MRYMIKHTIRHPYLSIRRIHPLKQEQIEELIEHTKKNYPEVQYIAVFGSTVDGRCRDVSDIDICVWGGKEYHFCSPDNDVYDVIHAEDLSPDSPLRKTIEEEGFVVYGKNLTVESKV